MKIGIAAEHPNDCDALIALLKNTLITDHEYIILLKNIVGDELGTESGRRLISIAIRNEQPDIFIYSRDLDGFHTNRDKFRLRNKEFERLKERVDKIGVFLLHIYELEALIYADIDSFNKYFQAKVIKVNDPMEVEMPKEELMKLTQHLPKPYHYDQNGELFEHLDASIIYKKCSYYKKFVQELKAYKIN